MKRGRKYECERARREGTRVRERVRAFERGERGGERAGA